MGSSSSTRHFAHGAALLLVVGSAILAAAHASLSPTAQLTLYAALFGPYAALLVAQDRQPLAPEVLVASAVAARVVFAFAEPVFSSDIYRYVWDGRVWLAGINPFVHAPSAEALAHLRDATIWPQINHPEVPTIYPPGAQYLFGLNAAIGGGVASLKFLMLAVEAAAVAACGTILARAGALSGRQLWSCFAVYALNPLVVVELAWSGHVDAVAWSLLAVAFVVWRSASTRSARWMAATLVGLSAAVKFLSLLAVPLMLFDRPLGSSRASRADVWGRMAAAALVPLVLAASYLPFLAAGPQLFEGLQTYADRWRSNDGGYRATAALAERALRDGARPEHSDRIDRHDGDLLFRFSSWNATFERLGWTETWRGREIPATTFTAEELAGHLARAVALLALLLAVGWAVSTRASPAAGFAGSLFVLYLFAPVVHPWYVAWLVPMAAITRSRYPVVYSFLALVAYTAWISDQHGGPWRVPTLLVALEYGLVVCACYAERIVDGPPRDSHA